MTWTHKLPANPTILEASRKQQLLLPPRTKRKFRVSVQISLRTRKFRRQNNPQKGAARREFGLGRSPRRFCSPQAADIGIHSNPATLRRALRRRTQPFRSQFLSRQGSSKHRLRLLRGSHLLRRPRPRHKLQKPTPVLAK